MFILRYAPACNGGSRSRGVALRALHTFCALRFIPPSAPNDQERNKGTSKARKTAPCAAGGGGGCSGGGTGGAATAGRPRGGRKAGGGGGGACPFLSPSLEEAEAFAHEVAAAPLDVEVRSG